MRFVRNTAVFLSQPITYRSYVHSRAQHSVEAGVYQIIAELYQLEAKLNGEETITEPLKFPQEPCEFAADLYTHFHAYPAPAYLVCCYASYPLTNKINAALYMHKEMKLTRTQPLTLCDSGNLSPLVAVLWSEAVKKEISLVCMEQVSEYSSLDERSTDSFAKADALALTWISPHKGIWQVISCGIEQFEAAALCRADKAEFHVQKVRALIDEMLDTFHLGYEEVLIVPQSLDPAYWKAISSIYPRVYLKSPTVNLCTADPFYALQNLYEDGDRTPYILLNFTDPAFGIGCLLLRREEL